MERVKQPLWHLANAALCAGLPAGIKAIKLYAWEAAYMERVKQLRETELKHIRCTQLLSMFNIGELHSHLRM